jgi:C2 domain
VFGNQTQERYQSMVTNYISRQKREKKVATCGSTTTMYFVVVELTYIFRQTVCITILEPTKQTFWWRYAYILLIAPLALSHSLSEYTMVLLSSPTASSHTMAVAAVVLLLCICSCRISATSETTASLETTGYSLPIHRQLADDSYVHVKRKLGLDKLPKESILVPQSARVPKSRAEARDQGVLSGMKTHLTDVLDQARSMASYQIGQGTDKLFGKAPEGEKLYTTSRNFKEFIARVNLRLGVTYPDVPVPGNKFVTSRDSLTTIVSRLFTTRHLASASVTGAKTMAMSHEGDRQYWHAMTSAPVGETNSHVKKAILTYLHGLYEESRSVPEEQRWWFYGRMLHAIEDSFSDAHCARNVDAPNLPIRFFQDYSKQVMAKHGASDTSPTEDKAAFAKSSTDKDVALKKKIAARKQKLYAQALHVSKEFLSIVFTAGGRDAKGKLSPTMTKDLWPSIKQLLDTKVFVFDSLKWKDAGSGGSLPDYAKDAKDARALDKVETENRGRDTRLDLTQLAAILTITRIEGVGLVDKDTVGQSDPFVVFSNPSIVGTPFQTVEVLPGSRSTGRDGKLRVVWNLNHDFTGPMYQALTLRVYDNDRLVGMPTPDGSDFMGEGKIKLSDFYDGYDTEVEKEVPLFLPPGRVRAGLSNTPRSAGKLIIRGTARNSGSLPGDSIPRGPYGKPMLPSYPLHNVGPNVAAAGSANVQDPKIIAAAKALRSVSSSKSPKPSTQGHLQSNSGTRPSSSHHQGRAPAAKSTTT